MVQIFNHGNWKKEKGLTIVEIIVSLAVIVIISVTVLSVAIYSSNVQKATSVRLFFSHYINDVAFMYQSYEDDDFELAFLNYSGQEIEYGVDKTFYFNSNFEYLGENGSEYYVKCDFNTNSLHLVASYADDKVISERSVSK